MTNPTASKSLFGKVLLLEDDPSHVLLISRALRNFVDRIDHVATFSEAANYLAAAEPDLIVSDLNLPDTPNLDTVHRLKQLSGEVPIIVLTSSSSVKDGVDAIREGAVDFLVKNFDTTFADVLGLSLSRLSCAQQLEAEQVKLRREISALEKAVKSAPEGLAVINSSALLQYSNPAFNRAAMLFTEQTLDLFALCSSRMHNAQRIKAELTAALSELQLNGSWSGELQMVGEKDPAFEITLTSVADKSTAHGCFVVWLRDIRERKHRERLQRELLSTTTHDLKGPLGAISLSCDVLLDSVDQDTRVRQLITRIASSAGNAIQLIEEFLSARRIEEGTLVLKPTDCEVSQIVQNAVDQYTMQAKARSVLLEWDLKEVRAKLDQTGLTRVVGNLVSNAIKFTPKGGRVMVRLMAADNQLVLSVSDTGSGMESHEVSELFRPFSRLEKHRQTVGTGLGLFIVKSIVDAHGGSLNVTSVPGQGTVFTVAFPSEPPVNAKGELVCLGA